MEHLIGVHIAKDDAGVHPVAVNGVLQHDHAVHRKCGRIGGIDACRRGWNQNVQHIEIRFVQHAIQKGFADNGVRRDAKFGVAEIVIDVTL